MHSKSDNLGYLKDQNNVKFPKGFAPWTPTQDPLGRAQGAPPPQTLQLEGARFACCYVFIFFPDSRFACGGMAETIKHETKKKKTENHVFWYASCDTLVLVY